MRSSLLIANDFPPVTSGIATVFARTWELLPPHRARVASPRMPGDEVFDAGYPIPVRRIPLPLGEGSLSKVVKTILTTIWTLASASCNPPARIHCGQVFSSGLAGWLCRRLFAIPYVVWVYGSETARLARGGLSAGLMARVLRDAQWIVTNSEATSDEFRAFGVTNSKIRRIYPGVDPVGFRPMPKDPAWIRRLDLDNRRVVLTLARLDRRKGHDKVLEALALLGDDRIVYLIAGTGREEDRLRRLAAELGLEDQVRFLGFVPDSDLPTVYGLCDLFVMPNRVTEETRLEGDIEGFGITFIEAGACGKPAIAGRSGGATEAVIDGETGILVDPHAAREIAAAIRKLLDDAELAGRMGRRARQRAKAEFDWRILARQVEEIL